MFYTLFILYILQQFKYLFISHNLAVVRNVCSFVGVMYLGKIVEYGNTEEIFNNPQHPYTKALLSAVVDDENLERIVLEGDIPSPIDFLLDVTQ